MKSRPSVECQPMLDVILESKNSVRVILESIKLPMEKAVAVRKDS